jgi:hypothetical protein
MTIPLPARLYSRCLLIEKKGEKITAVLVEDLTDLQKQILSILQLPEIIYSLSFNRGKKIEQC